MESMPYIRLLWLPSRRACHGRSVYKAIREKGIFEGTEGKIQILDFTH